MRKRHDQIWFWEESCLGWVEEQKDPRPTSLELRKSREKSNCRPCGDPGAEPDSGQIPSWASGDRAAFSGPQRLARVRHRAAQYVAFG